MKIKYHIDGMTCEGCRSGLEQVLTSIPEVSDANVSLERKEAIIVFNQKLTIDDLMKTIPTKYTITEKGNQNYNAVEDILVSDKSELKQLLPLFLIFGYITSASVMINYQSWNTDDFMMDFMGLFYVVFSFFKILDLKGFFGSFAMYDPLAKKISFYSWVYPFIEVGLGLMFLMRFKIDIALIITILILGITTIGVTKVLIDKRSIQCACLGTALKLPMTKATFIENSIMLGMAFWMLIKIYS
ncbi:heavy metal transporter [Aquimarina sp. AD1]|uniref:heavy-metal-associated domain-containing protein n=1 Tax=Aquimarina sp. (strain AD1) TaxID=1714848 RepID=UPI000E4E8F3C|nr:heavy metal-associated domain-containing protein [Aquimarina sp. AD1]AXT56821.1 heavy metal transporter [Aquimarina sp. AD1]RKN35915.1 heavy metal transporter [Aquimarina sp. AD1]